MRSAALQIETGPSGPDRVSHKGGDPASKPNESAELLQRLQYLVVTLVVVCSLIVVLYGIAMGYAVLQVHPVVLYLLLVSSLTLLGYVEALHYSNVSIERYDMTPYAEEYPKSCKVQSLVNTNEKVQRFLVGRQFFVIFVVFIVAQCTTLPHFPEDFLGMPKAAVLALLGSGIPGIMIVLTFGQLIPQLFVEEFTIPFINMYGCYAVTQLCFAAEFVGVCNFSWLLFHGVDTLFFGHKKAPPTNSASPMRLPPGERDDPTSPVVPYAEDEADGTEFASIRMGWFDVLKHIWSTGVTLGALIIVGYGISQGYSVLEAPVPVLYVIFFGCLTLLFYLEGLMICVVATQYWDPEEFKISHPRAYAMHILVNKPDTVKKFIVGRQFFTLMTNFLLAQVSVFPSFPSNGYDPILFFIVVRSGLVGVMITLAFAQLLPELLAARHPLSFMNFYGSVSIVRLSLAMDKLGVGHCAWFIYYATRGMLFKHPDVEIDPEKGGVKTSDSALDGTKVLVAK